MIHESKRFMMLPPSLQVIHWPPLTTDLLRWKRVILFNKYNTDLMVIYNMNDNQKVVGRV